MTILISTASGTWERCCASALTKIPRRRWQGNLRAVLRGLCVHLRDLCGKELLTAEHAEGTPTRQRKQRRTVCPSFFATMASRSSSGARMKFSRREFIESAAVTSAAIAATPGALAQSGKSANAAASGKTVVMCKYTGIQSIDGAYELMR